MAGLAFGQHANDPVARAFFDQHQWLDMTRLNSMAWFYMVVFTPVFLQSFVYYWWRKRLLKKIKGGMILGGENSNGPLKKKPAISGELLSMENRYLTPGWLDDLKSGNTIKVTPFESGLPFARLGFE